MEEIVRPPHDKFFDNSNKKNWFTEKDFLSYTGMKKKDNSIYPSGIMQSFNDKIITLSYKAAIEINENEFRDKVVLDINSGIGLNSLLAARAGAKKVFSIEPNYSNAFFAKQIVKDNNYSEIIEVINKDIYTCKLKQRVDIIICNWTGYFLLQNSLIRQLIFARDNYLNEDGVIFPDKVTLYLAGIEDIEYKFGKISMWDTVYGINMSCLKSETLHTPLIDIFEKEKIISTICPIYKIDAYTVTEKDLKFSNEYELIFTREDTFSGLSAWFDVEFKRVPNTIKFTTGPYNIKTRFCQTIFYVSEDYPVSKGDSLKGSICVKEDKHCNDLSVIDIKISYHFNRKGYQKNESLIQMYKLG